MRLIDSYLNLLQKEGLKRKLNGSSFISEKNIIKNRLVSFLHKTTIKPAINLIKRGKFEFSEVVRILRNLPNSHKALAIGGMVLPGSTVPFLILIATYKIYRDHFTQESKICDMLGKTHWKSKDKCIKSLKKKYIVERIEMLQKLKIFCLKDKYPKECNDKLNSKIKKLRDSIKRII